MEINAAITIIVLCIIILALASVVKDNDEAKNAKAYYGDFDKLYVDTFVCLTKDTYDEYKTCLIARQTEELQQLLEAAGK